uniref:rRNA methyltransferase 2, mitochondrial n=1 Tax=Psilocybe cubensis TaxID=181762 RepID=A0A8H7XLS9_PSICU
MLRRGSATLWHTEPVVDLGAAPGGWSQVVADKLGWNRSPPGLMPLSRNPVTPKESHPIDNGTKRKKWNSKRTEELDYFDPLNIDSLDPNTGNMTGRGTIIAVDLLKIESIPGVQTLQADFLLSSTTLAIKNLLRSHDNPDGKVDVVLSDMAANVSGNNAHDIEDSLQICEAVFEFATNHLRTAESIGRRRGGVLLMKFFAHPLLEQFKDDKLKPNFNHVSYIKPSSSRATSREGYYLCQGWRPTLP